MPMSNVTIIKSGIEKEFILEFIKSFMNEDAFKSQSGSQSGPPHTLLCKIGVADNEEQAIIVNTIAELETVLDSVFSSSSNTPYIWFIIDTNIKIKFARTEVLSKDSTYYRVFVNVGQVQIQSANGYYLKQDLYFTYSDNYHSAPNYTSIDERSWKYQIVFNENVLYFIFGDYNSTFPLSATEVDANGYTLIKSFQVFSYKDTNLWIGGLRHDNRLYGADGIRCVAKNRLSYINNSTNPMSIETIHSKVAVTNTGNVKSIAMNGIWDSTFNNAVMYPVNIGNTQCVYLNNYTVMPI